MEETLIFRVSTIGKVISIPFFSFFLVFWNVRFWMLDFLHYEAVTRLLDYYALKRLEFVSWVLGRVNMPAGRLSMVTHWTMLPFPLIGWDLTWEISKASISSLKRMGSNWIPKGVFLKVCYYLVAFFFPFIILIFLSREELYENIKVYHIGKRDFEQTLDYPMRILH